MAYKNRAVSASLAIPAAALLLALALGGCCGTTWFQRMERQPYWDEGGWLFYPIKTSRIWRRMAARITWKTPGGSGAIRAATTVLCFGELTGGVLGARGWRLFYRDQGRSARVARWAIRSNSWPSAARSAARASYCSGATYAAFIEALNLIFFHGGQRGLPALDDVHYEAMRMQEPDGGARGRREILGPLERRRFRLAFALVQYSAMGAEVAPRDARPAIS
jgi:hypothetical protein